MRAKSEYPSRHGDQHSPDGSDPLSDAYIKYDVMNVGDWLSVEASPPSVDAPDTEFSGQAGILLQTKGPSSYWPIVLRSSEDDGVNWTELRVGFGSLELYGSDRFSIFDHDGTTIHQVSGVGSTAAAVNPSFLSVIDGAGTFTVQTLGFQGLFEIRPDGSIHGKTGAGPVVFDL